MFGIYFDVNFLCLYSGMLMWCYGDFWISCKGFGVVVCVKFDVVGIYCFSIFYKVFFGIYKN